MSNPQTLFGPGVAWATPLTDSLGNAIANPTPIMFAATQDVSADFSFDKKLAYGQNMFPFEAARAKGTISGKITNVRVLAQLWNAVFFGQTLTAGIYASVYDTVGAAIPTTPFQITPTIPSSGTWSYGLSVRDSNDLPLTLVASGPAAGQYSVAAGVYTFASADTGKTVFIDYVYTATSTTAHKSVIINQPMGSAPFFQLDLLIPHAGNAFHMTFNRCLASKFSLATKLDDFTMPEFDFDAFSDPSGHVITYGTTQ